MTEARVPGTPGPLPGTWWNGECPCCREDVFSDFPTDRQGLEAHVAIHHRPPQA